jgi:hypothetical protein
MYESRGVALSLHYQRTTHRHKLMKMAATPLLFLLLATAVCGQSALDGFDPNANGTVRGVVVQPDGTLDTAFNPNANDFVLSIAV